MDTSPSAALDGGIVEPTENTSSDSRTATFLRGRPGDTADDGRWLTYEELAKFRGISTTSAKRLAQRSGWPQQHDDQRAVRILVPLERLSPGMSGISEAFGAALAVVREAHAGEIRALREQLAEARCERDQERERARNAEESIAAERQRAETLHEQLHAAKLAAREALDAAAQARWQVAEAQQIIASLSIQADVPQEAMGRLWRLLSMLRGR